MQHAESQKQVDILKAENIIFSFKNKIFNQPDIPSESID